MQIRVQTHSDGIESGGDPIFTIVQDDIPLLVRLDGRSTDAPGSSPLGILVSGDQSRVESIEKLVERLGGQCP